MCIVMSQMLQTFDREFFYGLYKPDHYGPTFACAMLDMFFELTPPLLDDLETALDAQDVGLAVRLLHQLKGSAGAVGGSCLMQLSQRRNDDVPLPDIQMIRNAYADLEALLRAERKQLSRT